MLSEAKLRVKLSQFSFLKRSLASIFSFASLSFFLYSLITLKMAERSEAKNAKRSFASNYFNFYIWRKASLCVFSFASLSILREIKVDNKMVILPARVNRLIF